jgi:hypothetical protein
MGHISKESAHFLAKMNEAPLILRRQHDVLGGMGPVAV